MAYQDVFGYLPVEESFSFSFGSVSPVQEFRSAVDWVERHANINGYLYPDVEEPYRSYDRKTYETIPKSRPGLIHRVPVTHRMNLRAHSDDQQAARYGLAGFLMHMLAFVYGYRCHFYDWWLDGRVRLKSSCDYHEPRLDDVVYCLETAVAKWSGWPDRQRTVALNALFLKTRSQIYESEWERFQAEYQVFDALYAIARDVGIVAKVPHPRRIPAMCNQFGIPTDRSHVDIIVRLRNDLLHEALWDERTPGEARSEQSFYSSIWLDNLCRRLGLALLGVSGAYVQSSWWGLSMRLFSINRPL